jgi:hypothetical protein
MTQYHEYDNTERIDPIYQNKDMDDLSLDTILSDFSDQNFSPKLEQMLVTIHLKQHKTPKSGFHEIFRGKRVCKQFVSGLL